MGLKLKKLNSKGFSSHLLVPVLVISLIAAAGSYVVTQSKADTNWANGYIFVNGKFYSPDGTTKSEYVNNFPNALAYSPDGTKIVYLSSPTGQPTQDEDGKYRSNIYTASSDGTNQTLLAENISVLNYHGERDFKWSPDGQWIAYMTDIGARYETKKAVGLIKVDKSESLTITPNSAGVGEYEYAGSIDTMSFYPDSKSLFYAFPVYEYPNGSGPETTVMRFCKADIATTADTCTRYPDIELPDVPAVNGGTIKYAYASINKVELSPDGQKIAAKTRISLTGNCSPPDSSGYEACGYSSYENLYTMNLDGTNVKNLTKFPVVMPGAQQLNSNLKYTWSPAADKLAFIHERYAGSNTVLEYTGTYMINADGSQMKRFSEDRYGSLAWLPAPKTGPWPPLPPSVDERALSCEIVPPATIKGNTPLSLTANFTNNGLQAMSTTVTISNSGTSAPTTKFTTPSIPAGQTVAVQLPAQTIPFASYDEATFSTYVTEEYINGTPTKLNQSCNISLPLPKPTVSISGATVRSVPYNKAFSISGTASVGKTVDIKNTSGALLRSIVAGSTGKFSTTYTVSRDTVFYGQVRGLSVKTGNYTAKVTPVVNGAITRTVKKGSNTTISGQYTPGTKVTIKMRKPTDPAGKYSKSIYATANSSGAYSFTFKADTKKVFYVQAPNGTKTPLYTVNLK